MSLAPIQSAIANPRFFLLLSLALGLLGGLVTSSGLATAETTSGAESSEESSEEEDTRASLPPTWPVPDGGSLVGEVEITRARHDDTLVAIARREGLGYTEVLAANPDVDRWVPRENAPIVLPRQRILPEAPRTGVVVNLAEMRLYHFKEREGDTVVTMYPVGIGREGWSTPTGSYRITERREDPTWTVPQSIRNEAAERGEELPAVVAPGPHNPLGTRALRLDNPSYLIHGTNRHYGVGMRVSHGCIRMYNEHVEAIYPGIDLDTRVTIVNQPFKATVHGGILYLEAHAPIPEEEDEAPPDAMELFADPIFRAAKGRDVEIDWQKAVQVAKRQEGLPVPVGRVRSRAPTQASEWVLQAGSFSSRDNAENLSWRLNQSGFSAFVEMAGADQDHSQYRVILGPFEQHERALEHRTRLLELADIRAYLFIRGGQLPRVHAP